MAKESGHLTMVAASNQQQQRRRWPSLMPLLAALVVFAEIAFLGRLDMAEKAASVVEQWSTPLYSSSSSSSSSASWTLKGLDEDEDRGDTRNCEEWLEREDAVPYSRDFGKDPILVHGMQKVSISLMHFSSSQRSPFLYSFLPPKARFPPPFFSEGRYCCKALFSWRMNFLRS